MKKEILCHYGEEKQVQKTIEEMAELTQVLSKFLIDDFNVTKEKITEEIADVINMLDYLVMIFGIDRQELQMKMFEKDKRTIENLKK